MDLCPPREASPAVLGVCTVESFLPGPILLAKFGDRVSLNPPRVGPFFWPTLVIEWGLCPPSEASPAVLGVWTIALYLSGPFILAKFGYRVGLFSPREASPALLGVCTVELYLPGPIILAQLVIEWVFARRVWRLRQLWAFGRFRHISRGPSLWPSSLIEWVFARRVRRLGQFWACVRLRHISRGPSLWPSLVIEWVFCPPGEASPAALGV